MVPPQEMISVVVPTLNEAATIGACLGELIDRGFDDIVVVDGGSGDGTADIVRSFPGVRLVVAGRGRGRQIGAGVNECSRPIVVMLHADTRLPADAAAQIVAALARADVAGGAFRLRFDVRHPLLDLSSWASRFETRFTTFGDQALFARRAVLDAVGVPDVPLLEDVELRRRVKRAGRFIKLEASVVTSARRFVRKGVVMCQLRNALILSAYSCGVPIAALARFYGAQPLANDIGAAREKVGPKAPCAPIKR